MSDSSAPIKVLSVVGAGRSGTTILASILGEIDGFASAGELRWLWERGVQEERPCGCGEIPACCPVWAPVIARALSRGAAGGHSVTVEDIVAAQKALALRRNLPRLLRSVDSSQDEWDALHLVRAVTRSACVTLAETTGARVVVDTSKRPLDAAVLAGTRAVDHYVLHMVRDPRAVVHSWRRAKSFTTAGRTRAIGTRSLPSTVRRWTGNCLTAEALRRLVAEPRWLHLRYEDFAADPRVAVDRILALVGEDARTPFTDEHTVLLRPNHIVAGNPSRFTTGSVVIAADEEWRRQMPRQDRLLVGLTTMPLMLRYGYVGPRHGRRRT